MLEDNRIVLEVTEEQWNALGCKERCHVRFVGDIAKCFTKPPWDIPKCLERAHKRHKRCLAKCKEADD